MNLDDDLVLVRGLVALFGKAAHGSAYQRIESEINHLRHNDHVLRAKTAEAKNKLLYDALRVIATSTYPARYLGETKDGMKMYGASDDASRFAQSALEKIEALG